MIQDALAKLLDGEDLSRDETRRVMDSIMAGGATPAQIGGFLVALRLKGETADEIAGAAEAMRDHVVPVRPKRDDLVDTAGTGGDGGRTFNISTAAALVAAAAGAGVAKHGNRAVSSLSGSADVLERLGFELDLSPDAHRRVDRRARFRVHVRAGAPPGDEACRPGSHRARNPYRVQRARTADESRPAHARRSSASTPPTLVPVIADVLARLGARRAFVVHGSGGIDELSPAGPNLVCEVVDGDVHRRELDPLDLGIPRCDPAELRGGTPDENAARHSRRVRGRGRRPTRRDPAQRRRGDRRRRPRAPTSRAGLARRARGARLGRRGRAARGAGRVLQAGSRT